MGFDTSHHPVDIELIQNRIIPYICGKGDIDDLVSDAVRIAKARFRANAWGLSVLKHFSVHGIDPNSGFDSMLHIWGRPFFVTVNGTFEIGEAIDKYLAASPNEASELAREMLRALDPSLVKAVTAPEFDALPPDADIAMEVRRNLDLLRAAYAAFPKGQTIDVGGESVPPEELLSREVPYVVLSFAAELRPGWMDRGYVWPTTVLKEAGIEYQDLFEPPKALLGPIGELDVDFFVEPTITENDMVGGYCPPLKVPQLRLRLDQNRDKIEQSLASDANAGDIGVSIRKLIEAVRDAERRGLAFAEATEIYSSSSGVVN